MIKKTNANKFGVVEYAVSTEEEVAHLPYLVAQGSTCVVIATANVYMFDESDLSWHSLVDGAIVAPNELKSTAKEVKQVEATPLVTTQQYNEIEVEVAPQSISSKKSKKHGKKVK